MPKVRCCGRGASVKIHGSFRKAGAARAEARALAEAEEAERLAREAEVPQSPARPYECWCAPAPAPFAAPAPAPFEAEAEAYSEEEELAFEDEPLAGESVYEPDVWLKAAEGKSLGPPVPALTSMLQGGSRT